MRKRTFRIPRPRVPARRLTAPRRLIPARRPGPPVQSAGGQLPWVLRCARPAALITLWVLAAGTTAAGFALSYHGLHDWATGHGYSPGWEAAMFPVTIDAFVAFGEVLLFVSVISQWRAWSRRGGWALSLTGTAASIAFNVGHTASAGWLTRVSFAVPPVAAAGMLWAGLSLLKRLVAEYLRTAARAPARPHPEPPARPPAGPPTARPAARAPAPPPLVAGDSPDARRAREHLRSLLAAGDRLPSANRLAADYLGGDGTLGTGNRRLAGRILAEPEFTAQLNGARR